MLFSETLISCKPKNKIIQIKARNFQKFNRGKFNLDLALYDWSERYKKASGSERFEISGIIIEKFINAQVPH